MSYHRFTNLREIFQGDLSGKLNKDVVSRDCANLECNCRSKNTKGCSYNNVCRDRIVVYKVECNRTRKMYIGNTQQFFKKRMQQHHNEVRKLHQLGERSDSYAKHFASTFKPDEIPTPDLQRENITCSIIWQGRPISTVKTFGSRNCALCARERLEILKQSRKDPNSIINSCNEIYGACRHNPKFHRYEKQTPSTDESLEDERVTPTKVTTEIDMCGSCLTEV